MGFYTAVWKLIIEHGLEFVWKYVPEKLMELGVFTDARGSFPMYHYMYLCPALISGVLSNAFASLTFKDQTIDCRLLEAVLKSLTVSYTNTPLKQYKK
jgi:hypothetical protein